MTGGGGRELDADILRNLLVQTTRAYDRQMEELERQRQLAEVTLASIADGVVVSDTTGSVRTLNAAAERLTGWSAAEAAGRPLGEVVPLEADPEGGSPAAGGVAAPDLASAGKALEGVTLVRRDGRRVPVKVSAAPILDGRGELHGHVLVLADVSDQRLLALQLAHQATRDPVTGLVNRSELQRLLGEALAAAGGEDRALCYLDLDRFKLVNDVAGHDAGDRLLRDVADILRGTVGEDGVVARVGSDEFAVLLHNCSVEEAAGVCRAGLEQIRAHRLRWGEALFGVTASCGVVPVTRDAGSVHELLSAADSACFAAKGGGGDRVMVYGHDSLEIRRREAEMRWVVELNRAMEEGRLRVHGQRIVPAAGGRRGLRVEVLVRMVGRDGRLHAAGQFVPAAERYGVVRALDGWVMEAAAAAVRRAGAGVRRRLECLGLNVSGETLLWDRFPELAREAAAAAGLEPEKLCFEVTESAAIREPERAVEVMETMGAMGFRFALDDFGSGMSSYGYLRELPVHVLKIDRGFVQDLAASSLDRAMVRSVTEIARILGLETVAEGVSGRGAAEVARDLGVDFLQGFWCHRPEPLEGLLEEGGDG